MINKMITIIMIYMTVLDFKKATVKRVIEIIL